MKLNRRKAHAIHTRYERAIKRDNRRLTFLVKRRIDMMDYHLPPYHATQYRGYERWLAHSPKYRQFRTILNELMEDVRTR